MKNIMNDVILVNGVSLGGEVKYFRIYDVIIVSGYPIEGSIVPQLHKGDVVSLSGLHTCEAEVQSTLILSAMDEPVLYTLYFKLLR